MQDPAPPPPPEPADQPGDRVAPTGGDDAAEAHDDLSTEKPTAKAVVHWRFDTARLAMQVRLPRARLQVSYQIRGRLAWTGALLAVLGLAITAAVIVPRSLFADSDRSTRRAVAAALSGGAVLLVGSGALMLGLRRRG
jgi:hypothetical protein